MKPIVIMCSFMLFIFSCNTKNERIAKTKAEPAISDTIKKVEDTDANITKRFVLGKFDYRTDSTFVKVKPEHSSKLIYLKAEVYSAFLNMLDSANHAGIELKIISGTRNFKEQKAIWERKWLRHKNLEPLERALKILEYSSMPSSSRHHWGTDIDLNSLNNSYFNSAKGLAEYNWLVAHANSFGFYQVYSKKTNGRTGYNLEKWHWSYLPLASQYLDFYNKRIINSDINGFSGYEQAQKVKIIKDYVNGISEKARNYK